MENTLVAMALVGGSHHLTGQDVRVRSSQRSSAPTTCQVLRERDER